MCTDDLIRHLEDDGHRVQTKMVGPNDLGWRRWKCTISLCNSRFRRVTRIGWTRGEAVTAAFKAALHGERDFPWFRFAIVVQAAAALAGLLVSYLAE